MAERDERSRLHWERAMAVYYFDLRDEDALLLDEEGLEFSNLRDMQEEAAKSLADMARRCAWRPPFFDAIHGDRSEG